MSERRLGFVTQTHSGDVTVTGSIAAAAEAGFDFVEWYMDGASERTAVDRGAIEDRLHRHDLGLAVHLPFFGVDVGSPREGIRRAAVEELDTCIRLAGEMGAEKAVVHPDSSASPPEWPQETVRPLVVESIRELDEVARDAGVELCAENLPDATFDVHAFDELLSSTAVSMAFDTGHARIDRMDAAAMATFLDEWSDRVSHVHVNDVRRPVDEHLPVGSGTTDFETALAPLMEGWSGTVSLEVMTFDLDYVAWSKEKFEAQTGWTTGAQAD